MLTFHDMASGGRAPRPPIGAPLPAAIAWLDVASPTPDEKTEVHDLTGVDLPAAEQIAAIEPSNRLYRAGETLVLTIPALTLDAAPTAHTTPLAFIVTQETLVTLRYAGAKALDGPKPLEPHAAQSGGYGALVALLGGLVGTLADELEDLMATLNGYSQAIFTPPNAKSPRINLRPMIIDLGHARAKASQIGQCLNGLQRLVAYLPDECGDGLSHQSHARLSLIDKDVVALSGHEAHLSEKIQFLLDSCVGLIGVDQNDVFKILTIFSVVGIPPTVVVGVYGMNFKSMPEYDWRFGYPYSLALLALSVLLPAFWFKAKRWW